MISGEQLCLRPAIAVSVINADCTPGQQDLLPEYLPQRQV